MSRSTPKRSRPPKFTPKPRSADALTGTRYDRILQIHQRLGAGRHANAEVLAAELGVSSRTIHRDLDIMRDRFLLPLEYVPEKHTFHYTRPCTTLPLLRVDAGEALAFALAGRFFGGALGDLLGSIFRKIEPVLGGAVSLGLDSVERALSQPQTRDAKAFGHFLPLLEAILQHTKVRIDYAGTKRISRNRVVHPLHLAEIDQSWMLFAYDPALQKVRKFLLKRISQLAATDDAFEPPPDFDARKEVAKTLGRFSGDQEYEVRLALDQDAAFYAREETWHHSQRLADRPDGRVELTMRVNGLVDARNLAIRWPGMSRSSRRRNCVRACGPPCSRRSRSTKRRNSGPRRCRSRGAGPLRVPASLGQSTPRRRQDVR